VLDGSASETDLDLISNLNSIPDARMRWRVFISAWYLLLVFPGDSNRLLEPAGTGSLCHLPPIRVYRSIGHLGFPLFHVEVLNLLDREAGLA